MKTPAQVELEILVLARAVSALLSAGVEILSARVSCHDQPQIHLRTAPPAEFDQAQYITFAQDGLTHRAVQHQGCELVWITPQPLPGQPPKQILPHHERTQHHG
ncbi:MAG: hypothetical protein J0L85_05830 [Zoogloea sp.]|nr:hypothetical protein [Zoogloea sp.]MCA0185023.1 hypothetical protein [Pseudomonadota bacterium]